MTDLSAELDVAQRRTKESLVESERSRADLDKQETVLLRAQEALSSRNVEVITTPYTATATV